MFVQSVTIKIAKTKFKYDKLCFMNNVYTTKEIKKVYYKMQQYRTLNDVVTPSVHIYPALGTKIVCKRPDIGPNFPVILFIKLKIT